MLVSNLARGDSAVEVDVSGLVDGAYTLIDGFTGGVATHVTVTGARTRFVLNVADCDTRLLVFPASAVAAN